MSTEAGTSSVARLAERLAALSAGDLDEAARDLVRLRIADNTCALLAGQHTQDSIALGELAKALDPDQVSEQMRITYLCGTTRSTELDDIHTGSCVTAGSVVVPAAFVAGTRTAQAFSDEVLLAGVAAGYEAMLRLGLAVEGAYGIYVGSWSTYLAAPFGAAAAAARVFGLDAGQTAHALAIALTRSLGTNGETGGGRASRWLTAGQAAADGYAAAVAASLGFTGDLNLLERPAPLQQGCPIDQAAMVADADQPWLVTTVDTKPYRVQRQALAAVEAFITLLDERPGVAVEGIEVAVPGQYRRNIDKPGVPRNRLTPGIQYLLGMAAHHREGLYRVHRRPLFESSAVTRTMEAVVLRQDPGLTDQYPDHWGGRVTVDWADGTRSQRTVINARGSFRRPFGWAELADKYRNVVRASDLGTSAQSLIDGVLGAASQLGRPGPDGLTGLRPLFEPRSGTARTAVGADA